MALTGDEIGYIRDSAGDFEHDGPLVSNLTIQAIYDSTTMGNSDLDTTIVYVLRRLVGLTVRHITKSDTEGRTEQLEQLHQHYIDLLVEWERRTGIAGGRLTTGVLNLHLDYTNDDLTADSLLGL